MNTEPTTPRRFSARLPALLGALTLVALATGCAHKDAGSYGGRTSTFESARGHGGASAPPSEVGTSYGASSSAGGELSKRYEAPSQPSPDADGMAAEDSAISERESFDPAPRDRPGLGTSYGEHRWSEVRSVSFKRGNPRSPDAVLSLRYNDRQGVSALADMRGSGFRSTATSEVGPLRMSLLDGSGRSLQGAIVGGETYAVGETGQRYMIGIENNSGERYEVVTTVDGLDVIDGENGSLDKRGYVVEPFTSFVIEGWRTSDSSVAAFRFSAIDDSYAGRTGRPRNIGVIGAAFFHERSRPDYYELQRRDHADPFPGR